MTHSHEMDMVVAEAALPRADAAYCGLIAFASKAAKFRNRLKCRGFNVPEKERLTALRAGCENRQYADGRSSGWYG